MQLQLKKQHDLPTDENKNKNRNKNPKTCTNQMRKQKCYMRKVTYSSRLQDIIIPFSETVKDISAFPFAI